MSPDRQQSWSRWLTWALSTMAIMFAQFWHVSGMIKDEPRHAAPHLQRTARGQARIADLSQD
jgi:hypothetical protein